MGVTEIPLSCVVFACLMSSSIACIICCHCGSFSPNDPYYFENDTSSMICALDKPHDSMNASDLYIKFNNMEVDPAFITILNESAILFNKSMKVEDDGKYYCHKRGVEGIQGFVGGQSVNVDYPLQSINDIVCIWHNWVDRLVCRWTLPPYRYNEFITVKLIMYNGAAISCPNMVNKNECTWTPENTSLDMYSAGFQLNITNTNQHKSMTMAGPWISKNRDENVKPYAVNSFQQTFTNQSTCLLLTWTYDTDISHLREKHYRIQYAAIGDPSQKHTVWSVDENVTVCDLTPYTLYKFTIAVHPDRNAVKGYWSDPVTKEFQTDQDVPGAAPDLVGFRQPSESCNPKQKKPAGVTSMIYFKSIPEVERNGLITNYRVDYTDLSEGTMATEVIVNRNTTSVNLHLLCNKLYNVSISAATVKGYSPHQSSLIIDTTGMTPVNVMVERNASLYNVSWSVPGPVDFLTSYSVVYCQMVGSQQECAGELQKVTVPDSRTRHQLLPLTTDTTYLFGVSIVRAGIASAAKFESCIYIATETPNIPEFSVDDSIGENSLRVMWDPVICNNKQPYVTSFTITWCQTNDKLEEQCVGPRQSMVIPSSSKTEYIIRNLEKDKRYGVTMLSSSSTQTSLPSEMKYGTATNSDISTGSVAGIVIASLFLLVFIIAGVVFVGRILKKRCTQATTPYEIETPEVEKGFPASLPEDSSNTSSTQLLKPTNHSEDLDGQTNVQMLNRYQTQFSQDSARGDSISSEPESPNRMETVPMFPGKVNSGQSYGSADPSNPYIQVESIPHHQQVPGELNDSQRPIDRENTTESNSSQVVNLNPTDITVGFVAGLNPMSAGTNHGYIGHNQVRPVSRDRPVEEVSAPETNSSGTDYLRITKQSSGQGHDQSTHTSEGISASTVNTEEQMSHNSPDKLSSNLTGQSSSSPIDPHNTNLQSSSLYVDSTNVHGQSTSPLVASTNITGSSPYVDSANVHGQSPSPPVASTNVTGSSPYVDSTNVTGASPPVGATDVTGSSPYVDSTNVTGASPPVGATDVTGSSPYVDSTNVTGSSLPVASTNVTGSSLPVASTNVTGSSPPVASTNVTGSSPYVDSTNVHGQSPSPPVASTNVTGSSLPVASTNVTGSSPYVDSSNVHGQSSSPYVTSTDATGSSPPVASTNVTGSSPYVDSTNVHCQSSSPPVDSTNVTGSSPYVDSTNGHGQSSSTPVSSAYVTDSSPYVTFTNVHGQSPSPPIDPHNTTLSPPSPYVDSTDI